MESKFRLVTDFGDIEELQELHQYYEQITGTLTDGKSVREIAKDLELSLSEFVHLFLYLSGRYGLLTYRVYFAISPSALEALAQIRKQFPFVGFDPRNLELLLAQREIEGATREGGVIGINLRATPP